MNDIIIQMTSLSICVYISNNMSEIQNQKKFKMV